MIVRSPAISHPGVWTQPSTQYSEQNQSIKTLQITNGGEQELTNLGSELATLSHQGRWIVLINPNHNNYKSILAQSGVKMERILLVHTKDDVEALWALEKALTNGTSSAVICWTSTLDCRDIRRLELVSKSACAKGIILQSGSDLTLAPHAIPPKKRSFH
ncbi:cell division protein [Shewanella sp. 202IG2-18]|uniref:SulA-like leucine-rich domain-containing protein n=1 Tax=Parashewanella hymeniacidonis TaxID=2807618 RepID=UPI00196159CA|nr:SulA-like leucine-rich domain-containing protein [Parashewanella hymeniacidonis]MBM7073408.1 cell division protein [Parashewanella hymeniacidonis]